MVRKPKSIRSRVRGGQHVKMGALRQMLINLEATTPGAGHWVLDQVPDSKELVDTLQDIITESFWAYKKSRTLKGRP